MTVPVAPAAAAAPIARDVSNPFVGPRPLETGQRIFGRQREIEELYYLLGAERTLTIAAVLSDTL